MKFATFLYQTVPSDMVATARRAEELGFESLWIPDHIVLPVEYRSHYPYSPSGRMPALPDTPFHDPLLALAFIAGVTSRIRLATGVLVLPMRNPFAVAKATASLDVLSGGRLIFGIGIGWLQEEFAAIGMEFEGRAQRTREYVALIKELWTSPTPEYEGRTVKAGGIRFAPKPIQQPNPPIVLGGDTDPSLRRAAQIGDGWYGIMTNLEQTRDTIARLRTQERAAHRSRPLEITVNPRFSEPLDLAQVRELGVLGVDRIILNVSRKPSAAIAELESLHAGLLAKV
jgi:probable F420-dependent oxidoreductase